MKFPKVEIEWKDIINENSWIDFEKIDKDIEDSKKEKFYSIGWLYKKDKDYVVIFTSLNLDKDENITNVNYEIIPIGVIKSIKEIK